VYKKLLVLASTKLVARLLASDFPSENPRPQTRNFPYTNTLALTLKTTTVIKIKNREKEKNAHAQMAHLQNRTSQRRTQVLQKSHFLPTLDRHN